MWRFRRVPWPSIGHISRSSPHDHHLLRTSSLPRPTCHARYQSIHSHTHSHANPSVPHIHATTSPHTTRHTHAQDQHASDSATAPPTSPSAYPFTSSSTVTCTSPPPPSLCSTASTSTAVPLPPSSPTPDADVPPCTSDPTPTLTADRSAASAYPTTLSDGSGLPGFYQRPLPQTLISFSSNRGRKIFREAMATGGMEGYFALAEQFQTQSEPSYCGPATLAMILNALALDPNRIWKGNWRWFSEEMLESCDTRKGGAALKDVDKDGMTYEEFLFLAECNGAGVQAFRACDSDEAKFRAGILAATSRTDLHLVASFSRKALGQTGSGHYSPIGGYHAGLDLALVLDVARFKYPPYWAPVSLLWRAISEVDDVTGRGRGYFLMSRGRPSTSFTPLSSACRIAADRVAWEKLAEYFCDQLPLKLREAQCKTPKQVFDVILSSLPVALSSVFTMYTHDLSRRLHASIPPQQASSSHQPHPPHLSHYSFVSPDSTHHHPHAIPPMTTIAPLLQQLSETSLYKCLLSDSSNEFKLEVSTQGHHPEDDPLPDRITPTTPPSRIPLHLRFHLAGGFIRPDHRSVEQELATLVLLACPAQVFDAIDDPALRSQIDEMLDIHHLPTQLQHEVHNLRQQMGILSDFCSCGHRMIHTIPPTTHNVKLANTVQHTYNRHAPHPPNTAVWMTFPPTKKKSFTARSTPSDGSTHDTKHRFVTRK